MEKVTIWHDTAESPNSLKYILILKQDGNYRIVLRRDYKPKDNDLSWKHYIEKEQIVSWLYLDDLEHSIRYGIDLEINRIKFKDFPKNLRDEIINAVKDKIEECLRNCKKTIDELERELLSI